MSTSKEGNFDWIVNYDRLESFFDYKYTHISESERNHMKVLVIGCGTSTLSAYLVYRGGFGQVVSIDNDKNVIDHMKQLYGEEKKLFWYKYDIVTGEDKNVYGDVFQDHQFDIIIDKGTLDAILVEGSVYTMLIDTYRLLHPNGIYFVCSLFSKDIIERLLLTPALGFSVHHYVTDQLHKHEVTGNIYICKKKNDGKDDFKINVEQLKNEEIVLMDNYFQKEVPLLTKEREMTIQRLFDQSGMEYLSLKTIHHALFSKDLTDYTFDLFQEDVVDFQLSQRNKMNINEVMEFLQTKQ